MGALLTPKEFNTLNRYIGDIADRLRLSDWRLMLMYAPCTDDDAWASIEPSPQKHSAEIRVCEGFRDMEPEVQRACIVHELLHLHLVRAENVIRCDLCDTKALSQSHYEQVWYSYVRLMEYGIEDIAQSIAQVFPLIPWETEADDGTPTD